MKKLATLVGTIVLVLVVGYLVLYAPEQGKAAYHAFAQAVIACLQWIDSVLHQGG